MTRSGLPIVQAIAEGHHGSVRVHSASGKGSTFEMVIPAVPGALASWPAAPDPAVIFVPNGPWFQQPGGV